MVSAAYLQLRQFLRVTESDYKIVLSAYLQPWNLLWNHNDLQVYLALVNRCDLKGSIPEVYLALLECSLLVLRSAFKKTY